MAILSKANTCVGERSLSQKYLNKSKDYGLRVFWFHSIADCDEPIALPSLEAAGTP
jgi:hypothetical protein